jgi:lipid A 3-O-deacylase
VIFLSLSKAPWLKVLSVFLAVLALGPGFGRADEHREKKSSGIFGFYLENDLFVGTDRGYTNGVKFVWVSPGLDDRPDNFRLPGWLDFLSRKLSLVRTPGSRRFVSAFLGQNIFTPNDIERFDLIVWDRPYAGIAYAGLGFHRIGRSAMEAVELDIGVVGPLSLAGDMQKIFHGFFGFKPPNGWAHQLKNEPVLGIAYDRKWKAWPGEESRGFGSDLFLHSGGELSNAVTRANAGVEMRIGWNLPKDFGSSCIRPGSDCSSLVEEKEECLSGRSRFGLQAFLALEGHAVLRDIFLDGNSFRKSHRVEKNPFAADIVLGLAVRAKRFKLSYGFVYQTKQFKTQTRNPLFGSWQIALGLFD